MAQQLNDIWQRRWLSLDSVMQELTATNGLWSTQQSPPVSRITELADLVNRLRAFAEAHFNFFYSALAGPSADPNHPLLAPPPDSLPTYSIEYILNSILNQIAYDLDVIQRAASQRLCGTDGMKRMLDIADRLAWDALQPALGEGKLLGSGPATVITYFQKSPSVRVFPYARAALIGVPFSCATVPRDLLAIPHEVGHYVFWHAKLNGKSLYNHLEEVECNEDVVPWARRWTEEIWADVYGCWIAGPVMVPSCEEAQLAVSTKDFLGNDGDHPTPVLRPLIRIKAVVDKNPTMAADLYNDWQRQIEKVNGKFKPFPTSPDIAISKVTSPGVIRASRLDVDQVFNAVINVPGTPLSTPTTWWSKYLGSGPSMGDLATSFERQFERDLGGLNFPSQPTALTGGAPDDLWLTWANNLLTAEKLPILNTSGASKDELYEIWRCLLIAEDWTTEIVMSPHE